MPLVGLDSDNGSEFINQHLYSYCQQQGITFTRSRAWKKNDSAHVEQKNGAIVRHLVGYDRFASQAAYAQLARVYALARLHVNFFQPVQKLVSKTRAGARMQRVYDRAQTPYQRLCARRGLAARQPRRAGRALSASQSAATAPRPGGRARAPLDPRRPRSATAPREYRDSHPLPQVLSWRLPDDGSGNPEL